MSTEDWGRGFCYLPGVIEDLNDRIADNAPEEWNAEGIPTSPEFHAQDLNELVQDFLILLDLSPGKPAEERRAETKARARIQDLKQILGAILDEEGRAESLAKRALDADTPFSKGAGLTASFFDLLENAEDRLAPPRGRPQATAVPFFLQQLALAWRNTMGQFPSTAWNAYAEGYPRSLHLFLAFARAAYPVPGEGAEAITRNAAVQAVKEARAEYPLL